MVSKTCDIILIACLLLWTTGLAMRTRHGATNSSNVTNVTNVTNSIKPPTKVPLQLSFSAVLSSGTSGAPGEKVKVTADEAKLKIMIEDVTSDAARSELQPTDRTLVDVAKNVRHEQERFFDERVCFTFDLYPPERMMPSRHRFAHLRRLRAQLGRVSLLRLARDEEDEGNETMEMSKEEMQHMLFLGAMSDIYQVPLQIYDMATLAEGVKNITGLTCRPWRVNESRSMPLGPMVQALAETLGSGQLSSWWMQALEDDAEGKALAELKSLVQQQPKGIVTMTSAFEFCVADKGELLSTESLYRLTYQRLPEDENETRSPDTSHESDEVAPGEEVTIFEKTRSTHVLQTPQRANATLLATEGVAGGECADLTQGSTGEKELDEELNAEKRLQRINREAAGHWDAGAYDFWNGLKVREVLSSLGTEMGPLKLPLKAARPSFLRQASAPGIPAIPAIFDARKQWPKCNSIGLIRNQGRCGSCWAVAAATVMTDRFCVALTQAAQELKLLQGASNVSMLEDMQGLSLAPELLVQCDEKNNGCGGGRLDDAWGFLKRHGIPKESCAPYMHCPVPTQRSCSYGWEKRPFVPYGRSSEEKQTEICGGKCRDGSQMTFFRVSEAYAVAKPRDVASLQRELLQLGPVEVAFYVFSDFMNYRSGVYFRTPGAYGPLGGHAVRLLGWGIDEELGKKAVDYWLIANSYSPHWGMHGLFKIRRGSNECGIESTPAAGTPDLPNLPIPERS